MNKQNGQTSPPSKIMVIDSEIPNLESFHQLPSPYLYFLYHILALFSLLIFR
jgi:hypothetical protein